MVSRARNEVFRAFAGTYVVIGVMYAFLWHSAPYYKSDSRAYIDTAEQVVHLNFEHFPLRPPGLTVLLVLSGRVDAPGKLFFLISLALYLIALAAITQLMLRASVALPLVIAANAVLLTPVYVVKATYVLTENFNAFLLTLAVVGATVGTATNRITLLLASGGCLAIASLVHPLFQLSFLALAVSAVSLDRIYGRSLRHTVRAAVALCLFPLIAVGGYSTFNYIKHDYFGVSYFAGYSLSTRTVPILEDIPDRHAAIREILIEARDAEMTERGSSHTAHSYIWRAEPRLRDETGLDGPELSKELTGIFADLIRRNPLDYQDEAAQSLVRFWSPAPEEESLFGRSALQFLWVAIQNAVNLGFLAVATTVVTTALLRRRRQEGRTSPDLSDPVLGDVFVIYSLVMVGYTALIAALFSDGTPRYRYPVEFLIVAVLVMCLDTAPRATTMSRPSLDDGRLIRSSRSRLASRDSAPGSASSAGGWQRRGSS